MLYRCLVKNGHAGSGQYTERSIFVRARSILDAMNKAKRLRGVKKGRNYRSGASILSIERAEI
jgi:hypothetical protein